MRIRRALLLSDVHLGWTVCARQHARLLDRLPEAADDAELIVLNGDIIDHHRGLLRGVDADLVHQLAELLARFRAEGRQVVYVEGNHDIAPPAASAPATHAAPPTASAPATASPPAAAAPPPSLPTPDRWLFDWEGAHGERIRVLHGHRFADSIFLPGAYERFGRHLLRAENYLYSFLHPARAAYRLGPGWLVGAVGLTEDTLWTRDFPGRVTPLLGSADVLVHGHFHFGAAHRRIAGKPVWRTGAWVSHGHLGSVDRMLRYRDGKFERIGLSARGFHPCHDDR